MAHVEDEALVDRLEGEAAAEADAPDEHHGRRRHRQRVRRVGERRRLHAQRARHLALHDHTCIFFFLFLLPLVPGRYGKISMKLTLSTDRATRGGGASSVWRAHGLLADSSEKESLLSWLSFSALCFVFVVLCGQVWLVLSDD